MILCLGEAIVDLICEREVDSLADAGDFRPYFGGALANVAVAARRAGADVAMAGGVGDDEWGGWLRSRLEDEGVDLTFLGTVPGIRTPVAFAWFDRDREPSFLVYGEGIAATLRSLEGHLPDLIAAGSALLYGSNTLVGESERDLTLRAHVLALENGVPVLFDPNLRANRWEDLDRALALCRDACRDAQVVRANDEEARWIAGLPAEADAADAAAAIAELGAKLAVVTRGADGAVMRGAVSAEHPGVEVEVVSTLGAGDAFMGTLAAGLAERGFDLERAPEVLGPAIEASSRACTVWQALA